MESKSAWLALLVSIVFGLEPVFFRSALTQFAAEDLVWLRFAGALPCFIILARGWRPVSGWASAAGCFLALNYLGFLKGIALAGPASSTVLLQSSSFIFVALSILIKDTQVSRAQIFALSVTLLGYLFYFASVTSAEPLTDQTVLGYFWVILSAFGWAIYAVLTRREKNTKSPHRLTAQSFLIALMLLSVVSQPTRLATASAEQALTLCLIICFTVLAYSCLGLALRGGNAAIIAPIIATNPLITLIALELERVLFHGPGVSPPLTPWAVIGVVLIVLGVGLVTRERKASDNGLR